MNLGYNAFGSQDWIRQLKPKGFFIKRKLPVGENQNSVEIEPGYGKLVLKSKFQVETSAKKARQYPRQKSSNSKTFLLIWAATIAASTFLADLLFDIF